MFGILSSLSKRSKRKSCKRGKTRRRSSPSGKPRCVKKKCKSGKARKRMSSGKTKCMKKKRSKRKSPKKRSKKKSPKKKLGAATDMFCVKSLYDMEKYDEAAKYKSFLLTTENMDLKRSPAFKKYHKEVIKAIRKSKSPILKKDVEVFKMLQKYKK